MQPDPAQTLSEHVHRTAFSDLPAPTVTATRRDILDTLGATLGGSGAPGVAQVAGLARRWGGLEESNVLVLGGKLPAPQAAMVNATMGHALDFDDTYDRGGQIHPGISTLAASLAVAESVGGVSGREFVLAVALGLDVSCRLALAATTDRGWHRTATFGIFGATMAAGKLLGLSAEQLTHALGIAYSQSAGNRQCIVDGALTKRFQAGQAASGAVVAVMLAQEGLTGARDIFAGRYGFFPMYQPEGYDLTAIADSLGEEYRGAELSFKPYPCGRGTHAIIDAALDLHRDLGLDHLAGSDTAIVQVTVTTNPAAYHDQFAPGSNRRRPSQVVEAQFSVPFLVAAALVRGRVGISEVAGVEDPQVLGLSEMIDGASSQDAQAGWARLEVRLSDGRSAARETTGPSGSPDRPLSDAQLEAKFRDCARHAAVSIGKEVVDQALNMVRDLEDAADATALFRLFCGLQEN
jgi:2-methylcitrate dehydratase PrpD